MKLEFKKIAPYLPYNLNIIGQDENIRVLNYSDIKDLSDNGNLYGITPILKPLSDLGELIKKEFQKEEGTRDPEIINLFSFENTGFDNYFDFCNLDKLPYECIVYIFKNHYDFFNLIEK